MAQQQRQEPTGESEPRTGGRLLAPRPGAYAILLTGVVLGAALYNILWNGIFACQASGYWSNSYLSYCQATGYGDYDHGAFWFDLEPAATEAAKRAQVVFLGNSKTQFAFSTPATDTWFASRSASYYLLGFTHYVNVVFEAPLLRRIGPRARVYVINVDRFFLQTGSRPVQAILEDSAVQGRYKTKRQLQPIHRRVCQRLPMLCKDGYVIYRSRTTGAWWMRGGEVRNMPVSYDGAPENQAALDAYAAVGKAFLTSLPVPRQCVILTQVPFVRTDTATASAIAAALGSELVAPRVAGLNTFDESHLDPPSAERWSAAFLEAAGPRIEACLNAEDSTARAEPAGAERPAQR